MGEQDAQGLQVHTDASIQSVSNTYAPRKAGLGIHLQGVILVAPTELLIRAAFKEAQDPLRAEMLALQLASKVVQHLQINMVVYNTDSQLLAAAINSEDPIIQAPDWRISLSLAQFIINNTTTQFRCKKIPRSDNKTSHALAKFA
jgi:ribonuclease HI